MIQFRANSGIAEKREEDIRPWLFFALVENLLDHTWDYKIVQHWLGWIHIRNASITLVLISFCQYESKTSIYQKVLQLIDSRKPAIESNE